MLKRKGWLLFLAVIWIIILAAPPLRSRLMLMWRGGPQTAFTVVPSGYPKNFWPTLAKQNSQSLALQFMSINTQESPFLKTASMADLTKIDQLIQKNPQAEWLPAIRLMMTISSFQTNRVGGELSDPSFPDNLKNGIPSPEISPTVKRNFSDSDLYASLKICKLGEKREPQNSYYNWIESCLYWMSWQDDKARQALCEGAAKSGWNNHLKEFYTAVVQGYQQAMHRPLLAQEKIWIINAPPLFSAQARYREFGRIITWSAIKDRRAGNNARALQTLSDTHHLMYLASRGSTYFINSLVASAIMAITTSGAYAPSRKVLLASMKNPKAPMPSEQRLLQKQMKMLAAFVALAKSQHRPELAHQIEVEETARIQAYQKTNQRYKNHSAEIQASENQTQYRDLAFTAAWYLCVILLLSLLGTIALLIFVTAGKYFLGHNVNSAKPVVGKIIYGALFSGGVIAAILTLLFVALIAFIEHADVAISGIAANVFMMIIMLLFLFVLSRSVIRLINADRDDNREFLFSVMGVLVSAGVFALIATTWPYIYLLITSHAIAQTVASNAYYYPSPSSFTSISLNFLTLFDQAPATYLWRTMIAAIPVIFGSLFFIVEIKNKQTQLTGRKSTPAIAWRIVIGILKGTFLAMLFSLWGFATMMALGHLGEYQTPVIALLCFCGAMLPAIIWDWWRMPNRRAAVHYGLQLSRRSLQWWLCLASLGILATLLIQLSVSKPMQQEANAQLYGDMSSSQKMLH